VDHERFSRRCGIAPVQTRKSEGCHDISVERVAARIPVALLASGPRVLVLNYLGVSSFS